MDSQNHTTETRAKLGDAINRVLIMTDAEREQMIDAVLDAIKPEEENDEAFAEKISALLESQPAQITDREIDEIEAAFGASGDTGPGSWGLICRCALATLTKPGKDLVEIMENDREGAITFAHAALGAENYAERLRNLANLMESAGTRIRVALCWRDDMAEVLAAAEAESESKH